MTRRAEALAVLVRAPAGLVYAVLTDVDGWDVWWPGCTTSRDPGGADDGDDHHHLVLTAGRRRIRLHAAVGGWRHDRGARIAATGRAGTSAAGEWWLEPRPDGCVVHLLVTAEGRRADRLVRLLGSGLQALKDHLELAVAVADGRVP